MFKNRIMLVILAAGSVLIIIGVSLMAWMIGTEDERGVIEVKLEDSTTESLTFESLSLVPGQESEYIIKLKKASDKKYHLEIDFVDIDEEKTLKNYARVKILSNDEIVCDELLATAFEDDKIVLPVDFEEGLNTELKVVYYLPIDVGNGAKNAEAAFELQLKASNE